MGAYTSIAGDGGITVARAVDIAITTGNSYTCYTAIEGARRAAALMGVDPAQALRGRGRRPAVHRPRLRALLAAHRRRGTGAARARYPATAEVAADLPAGTAGARRDRSRRAAARRRISS